MAETKKKRKARRRKNYHTPYTPEEEAFIRRWHGRKTIAQIAKSLKREYNGIKAKIRRMGLESTVVKWTPEELQQLRCLWGTKTAAEISEEIGRTTDAVVVRASKLHLSKERKIAYDEKGRRLSLAVSVSIAWSPQMLDDMKRMFATTKNAELAEHLGVSQRTIIRKARELGLVKDKNLMLQALKEGRAKARLTNITVGNSGRFKKGHRASPATEFGGPRANPHRWEIIKRRENEIQGARIPEESDKLCGAASV